MVSPRSSKVWYSSFYALKKVSQQEANAHPLQRCQSTSLDCCIDNCSIAKKPTYILTKTSSSSRKPSYHRQTSLLRLSPLSTKPSYHRRLHCQDCLRLQGSLHIQDRLRCQDCLRLQDCLRITDRLHCQYCLRLQDCRRGRSLGSYLA